MSLENEYGFARNVINFIEFLGWVVLALSVLIVALSWTSAHVMVAGLATATGFGFVIQSLVVVALCRVGKAVLDAANSVAAIAKIARLVHPKEALEATRPTAQRPVDRGILKELNGYQIRRAFGGVTVDGKPFDNVATAEAWILKQPPISLSTP